MSILGLPIAAMPNKIILRGEDGVEWELPRDALPAGGKLTDAVQKVEAEGLLLYHSREWATKGEGGVILLMPKGKICYCRTGTEATLIASGFGMGMAYAEDVRNSATKGPESDGDPVTGIEPPEPPEGGPVVEQPEGS